GEDRAGERAALLAADLRLVIGAHAVVVERVLQLFREAGVYRLGRESALFDDSGTGARRAVPGAALPVGIVDGEAALRARVAVEPYHQGSARAVGDEGAVSILYKLVLRLLRQDDLVAARFEHFAQLRRDGPVRVRLARAVLYVLAARDLRGVAWVYADDCARRRLLN